MTQDPLHTESFIRNGHSDTDSGSVNPELARLLDHVLEELNAGRMVDIDELLADHPDLRKDALEAFESILALHGSLSTDADRTPIVAELGDYRLIREIGRGGMGIVYLAEQKSLDRRVAVKILPLASLMDERRLARFRNESRAAASLRHPGIVSVHAVGQEKGVHYYVMDLIEGADLAAVIASIHGKTPETNETLYGSRTRAVGLLSTSQIFSARTSDPPMKHFTSVTWMQMAIQTSYFRRPVRSGGTKIASQATRTTTVKCRSQTSLPSRETSAKRRMSFGKTVTSTQTDRSRSPTFCCSPKTSAIAEGTNQFGIRLHRLRQTADDRFEFVVTP